MSPEVDASSPTIFLQCGTFPRSLRERYDDCLRDRALTVNTCGRVMKMRYTKNKADAALKAGNAKEAYMK